MSETLPLMPLNSHVLPGGKLKLRIFEPRYLRMIKEACAAGTGVGMCMLNHRGEIGANEHIYPLATLCNIIDFEPLEHGMLGVTLQGVSLYQIKYIYVEADGLRRGVVEPQTLWAQIGDSDSIEVKPLAKALETIYLHLEELNRLYSEKHFDDPQWVTARMLEVLPLDACVKQRMLQSPTVTRPIQWICELMASDPKS